MYPKYIKRLLDVLLSSSALLLFSPLSLLVALLVRLKLGSPILFCQERPGLHGKIFKMYKFRSMTDKRDDKGNLLPDAERLPKFGKFLRATSLDELPELLNIVKGDMSIVGPRPLLVKYLPLYNEEQRHRHDVRPGLTGLAQVNGRNALSWEEKFWYDVEYVRTISFWLDVKILFQTVIKVVKRDGISQAGEATMEEFRGTAEPENSESPENLEKA